MKTYAVRVSPRAMRNLLDLHAFIAEDSRDEADQWLDRLLDRAFSLAAFPLRAPLAPESPLGRVRVRHLIDGNYRILFCVRGKGVVILGVRHAARRPNRKALKPHD
ncbi:MAG: type II toxin-antitoxin system RelE/ParE family toxin [Phycisphaerales bacterium]|nr:type II toxin-antitoxin system RelE/ParE family toxin [Phycisphaerales bacterium]